MMWTISKFRFLLLPLVIIGLSHPARGQCTLFDFNGAAVNNPVWYACNGGNFTLNLQSPQTYGPYSIDWGDGSPIQNGASLAPPASVPHIYAATVAIYQVTFTDLTTGCVVNGTLVMEEATSASIQIPVGGLTQACAPQTMEFINSSTNTSTNTIFTWNFGDGSPVQVFDYTNLGQTISHTYMPGTVDCQTVVTLTAENNCNTIQGGASQATFSPIRIWDIDEAAIGASATVLCWPENTVTFTNATDRNCLLQGNIFQRYEYWNLGDYWGLGYDSIIDWRPWPPSFPQTISFPAIGTYTVHMLDSNICGIAGASRTIQIVAPPAANAAASVTTVCVGQAVTFTNLSSANANHFVWNFGDGSPPFVSTAPTFGRVFNTPGTFNVTLTASVTGTSTPCQDVFTIPVTVLPSPLPVIGFDQDQACDFLEVNFTGSSTGDIATWTWNLGNGNSSNLQNPPTQQYTNPGLYNVVLTVTSTTGCVNSTSKIVRVRPSPVAHFAAQDVCVGSTGSFMDLSSVQGANPIVSWNWDFGNGNISTVQNPTNTYAAVGTYMVTLQVATAHCSGTVQLPVTVEPNPTASFTVDVDEGCGPLTVQFTNLSTGAANYTWLFGDGAGAANESPEHTYTNFGNNTVEYIAELVARTTFGCTDTARVPILVYPGAQALFQVNYTPGCNPAPALFINNSQNASGFIWNFGDGSPESNALSPTHAFDNNGLGLTTYTVTLTALSPNGCNDQASQDIMVFPQPNFNFELQQDTGCAPFAVQFPIIQGAIAQMWNFGDGMFSTQPAPLHFFGNPGLSTTSYTVQLTATSAFGCTQTSQTQVVVHPNPVAQFSTNITSGCSPLEVTFFNQSLLADSVVWTYGDGATSHNLEDMHSHVFVNNTNQTVTYAVKLQVYTANGCSHTLTRNIEVHPQVVASFMHPPVGCSPSSFTINNTSQNASSFQWNLGNGNLSTAQNPLVGYQVFGQDSETFDITLVATSVHGCTGQATGQVLVHPKPVASILPDAVAGCAPLQVQLTNASTGAASFAWNYGNGQNSTTAEPVHPHTFQSTSTAPQSYTIRLIATSVHGCADTAYQNITVYPEVVAAFSPDAAGCSPLQVNFVNQSFGAVSYQYNFGNGNQAFVASPTHTFLNLTDTVVSYQVTMTAQSSFGCTGTATRIVTVYPLPQVIFAVGGIEGCFPAEVTFVNSSMGAESFLWNYGNGATSVNGDPTHTHTYVNNTNQMQNFIVQLTGTSEHGCTASATQSLSIIPQIVPAVVPPTGGCSPYEATFVNNSSGAFTYIWDFGDGTISQEVNPVHTFSNPTVENEVYTVTFTAQSLWGCEETLTFDIPVQGLPEAAFVAAPAVQQFPSATVTLTNLSNANSQASYTWSWGDGNMAQSNNPITPDSYTYSTWGVFDIRLRVGTELCYDEAQQSVRIDPPLPIASFTGETNGCRPVRVEFMNTSTFGVSYFWQFGDGNTSTAANPVHVYYQPGTYIPTLTATGPGGETHTYVSPTPIEVYPKAEAFFTVNPPVVTIPAQVFFLNLSSNASIFHWDFGDGNTSNQFSPHHFYETLGWHPVMLIASNIHNCPDTMRVEQAILGNIDSQIAFPNAFTPNPNGPNGGFWNIDHMFNNDIFFPQYKGVKDFEMQVFNRWGELLFESKDIRQGWDGYYRGRLCQQDVYVWKARVTFLDGGAVTQMGDVTLIR